MFAVITLLLIRTIQFLSKKWSNFTISSALNKNKMSSKFSWNPKINIYFWHFQKLFFIGFMDFTQRASVNIIYNFSSISSHAKQKRKRKQWLYVFWFYQNHKIRYPFDNMMNMRETQTLYRCLTLDHPKSLESICHEHNAFSCIIYPARNTLVKNRHRKTVKCLYLFMNDVKNWNSQYLLLRNHLLVNQ